MQARRSNTNFEERLGPGLKMNKNYHELNIVQTISSADSAYY